MQAVRMKDLKVGQWGLFDPIYGPEKVLAIDTYALGSNHRGAPTYGTSSDSGTWEAVRFHVTNERTEGVAARYVLRFPHEPVIAMELPADARAEAVARAVQRVSESALVTQATGP